MKRALLLDRDGVVNVDHGFVHRADQVEFVEGIFDVCHWFQRRGFQLVMITNQSGVARGLYTEQDVEVLHTWMQGEFARRGLTLARAYYCPHHPEAGRPPYNVRCACRKPEPGMLLQAGRDLGLDLGRSVLIGDRETDIEAAQRAGVSFSVRLRSPDTPEASAASLAIDRLAQLLEPPALAALERYVA